MVDSSEDELGEVEVEEESEEDDDEEDKLFNFFGTLLIPTWEASPVPKPYEQ